VRGRENLFNFPSYSIVCVLGKVAEKWSIFDGSTQI